VHDGIRALWVAPALWGVFAHNETRVLLAALLDLRGESNRLKEGESGVFALAENVYSTDGTGGTVALLRAMIDATDEIFPVDNAHMSVDEAHATEIYGPGGRRKVALLVLDGSVLVPLHTFGEALVTSGVACAPRMRVGAFHNLGRVAQR
jgi:7-keto-8-aminopelargonate synthetase-like enzyme